VSCDIGHQDAFIGRGRSKLALTVFPWRMKTRQICGWMGRKKKEHGKQFHEGEATYSISDIGLGDHDGSVI
jgi:hypothetical protein